MSVLSDRWIRLQCQPPTHKLLQDGRVLSWLSEPLSDDEHEMIQLDDHFAEQDIFTRTVINGAPYVNRVSEQELKDWVPMIHPFIDHLVRVEEDAVDNGRGLQPSSKKVISYGLTSYGYDVRLARDFKIFTNVNCAVVDPKALDEKAYVDFTGDVCIIPPNSYVLGHTVETFNIPDDVTSICVGKSTYARAGVAVNVTPIEAGFRGQVVIEIANLTNIPVKVYAGEGIAQFLFLRGNERCLTSYGDRAGKYQGQSGITLPKV